MKRLLLLVGSFFVLVAPAAQAASVEVTSEGLRIVDSTGDANQIGIMFASGGGWLVGSDTPFDVGPGCEPFDPAKPTRSLRCKWSGEPSDAHNVIDLGAGDDKLGLTDYGTTDVYAGAGDDELGIDQNAHGRLSGGDGVDRLTAESRVGRFSFWFDITLDGLANDNDGTGLNVVPDWEVLKAPGIVTGSDRGEVLQAHRVDGGGGDDILRATLSMYPSFFPTVTGGPGRDTISYDAPNLLAAPPVNYRYEATVLARDGEADTIDCTAAAPARVEGDAVDTARGCAPPAVYAGPAATPMRVDKRGYVTATIKCEAPSDIPCSGRAVLRTRPATLSEPEVTPVIFYARGSTGPITPGQTKKVRMKVAARYRRAITQRRKTITASLVVETRRGVPASSRTSILGDVQIKR